MQRCWGAPGGSLIGGQGDIVRLRPGVAWAFQTLSFIWTRKHPQHPQVVLTFFWSPSLPGSGPLCRLPQGPGPGEALLAPGDARSPPINWQPPGESHRDFLFVARQPHALGSGTLNTEGNVGRDLQNKMKSKTYNTPDSSRHGQPSQGVVGRGRGGHWGVGWRRGNQPSRGK